MPRTNPLVTAQVLTWRNRLSDQWRGATVIVLLLFAVSMLLLPALAHYTRLAGMKLPEYTAVLVSIATVYGIVSAHQLRLQLSARRRISWLASTPIPNLQWCKFHRSTFLIWIAVHTLVPGSVTALLLGAANENTHYSVIVSMALIVAGMVLGAAGGWLFATSALPARVSTPAGYTLMPQRYPVPGRGKQALLHLCTTRVRNHSNGQRMAAVLTPLLLMIPGNIGAANALVVMCIWLGLVLLFDLTKVMRWTFTEQSECLAATPLRAGTLLWLLGKRPLAWCHVIAATVGLLLFLSGLPLHSALLVCIVPPGVGVMFFLFLMLDTLVSRK